VPAVRCVKCNALQWVTARKTPKGCDKCGGEVRATIERRQEYAGGFETAADAKTARATAITAMDQGTHVVRDKITVAEYLEEEWLPSLDIAVAMGKLKPSTRAGYKSHVRHHFVGSELGGTPLQKLSPQKIAAHYELLRTQGRADGSKDEDGNTTVLSPSSVRRIHATLHKALREAVRNRLLQINPAGDIELGSGGKERACWNAAQLHEFLKTVREDRLNALWLLYATTGARRGELLALRWAEDVDLEAGKLRIHHTLNEVAGEVVVGEPKTKRGRRTISLDPATIAVLKRHRTAQKAEHLAAGPKWRESGYVFTDELGRRLHPGYVSRRFTQLVKASELPLVTLHGLRHSFATIALVERRLPVSMVSSRLGHKDVSVTLKIYAHVFEEHDEEAALDVASVVVPVGY
jgi:integrase